MSINELTTQELNEIYALQKKLFAISTENNPYLQNSTINPDLSKGLNTESKTVIGAINDIFSITTAVRDTNHDFIDRFNRIIGNEELNPDLVRRLSLIGSNFYEALFNAWNKASTSFEKTEAFQSELINLRNAIEEFIEDKDIVSFYSYEDKLFTGQTFTISCTPIHSDSVSIYINGVHYDNECFSLDEDNRTFTWIENDFDIETEYKKSTEFDCLKTYYLQNGNDYVQYEGTLNREIFNNINDFYEIDEDNSDKVTVRYSSYGITNKLYYRSLYNISFLNNVGKSIGKNPYNNNLLIDSYDWTNISSILNKNLTAIFKYTDNGKVRIILDIKNNSSRLFTLNSNNWEEYKDAAKVYVGNDSNITTFNEFCNAIYGTTVNTKLWLAFFAFKIGEYANIFVISNETDPLELSDNPAPGNWYYGWDDQKIGDERALTMELNSYNPYIDITRIFNQLDILN